jgi:hypothetical protein
MNQKAGTSNMLENLSPSFRDSAPMSDLSDIGKFDAQVG